MGPKLDLTHGLGFQKLDLTYRSGIHRYPQKPKDPLRSLHICRGVELFPRKFRYIRLICFVSLVPEAVHSDINSINFSNPL